MGMFFDSDWFDDQLKASGLTRASMAQAAGMTIDEIEMVFRDQRELEQDEMRAIARVLRSDPEEVALRSGAGLQPVDDGRERPAGAQSGAVLISREAIGGIHERMDRLEQLLQMVIARLDRLR
ncbi:MAG: XRE family transcriptional regulator [Acidobacteria bacterium]|nr:XRE family transcriptional regulator [Acidobacteriota bacterium]